MVLTPSSKTSGTPSSKPFLPATTTYKTPQSKHRINLGSTPRPAHPSPGPAANPPAEHPVEVVGRIRDHPDRLNRPASALQISSDGRSVRVRTDVGYRDFRLDGVSVSEEEDLDEFYKRYVGSRIAGVKLGAKCTVMMYGPTGSGKSHTMFGCARQAGIVYWALKDILSGGDEEGGSDGDLGVGVGSFVHVTVLEIYNEEIYDLLSSNGGGGGLGWVKGNAPKVFEANTQSLLSEIDELILNN